MPDKNWKLNLDRIRFGGEIDHGVPRFDLALVRTDDKVMEPSTIDSTIRQSIQFPKPRTTKTGFVSFFE
jgi:hypothetical protein